MGFAAPLASSVVAVVVATLLTLGDCAAQQPILVPGQPLPSLAPPPERPPTPFQAASRLQRRGDPAGALAILEKHLADEPRDVQSRFLRGVVLSDLKRSAEAIEAFAALTREYPEISEPYNNLAVLYAGDGRFDEARRALEQSLVANPRNAIARANLGDVYVQLARDAYERALADDPRNRPLRAKLTAITEIAREKPSAPAPTVNGETK